MGRNHQHYRQTTLLVSIFARINFREGLLHASCFSPASDINSKFIIVFLLKRYVDYKVFPNFCPWTHTFRRQMKSPTFREKVLTSAKIMPIFYFFWCIILKFHIVGLIMRNIGLIAQLSQKLSYLTAIRLLYCLNCISGYDCISNEF